LLTFEVHHDAAQVKALTKADMIEFYNRFILPTSPARSKLAIHLVAQTSAATPSGVTVAVEKGMEALGLNNKTQDEGDGDEVSEAKVQGNGMTPYVITDVRQFKSMMQVSAGPQPVKNITEFEELDSKL
jgi:insulysin